MNKRYLISQPKIWTSMSQKPARINSFDQAVHALGIQDLNPAGKSSINAQVLALKVPLRSSLFSMMMLGWWMVHQHDFQVLEDGFPLAMDVAWLSTSILPMKCHQLNLATLLSCFHLICKSPQGQQWDTGCHRIFATYFSWAICERSTREAWLDKSWSPTSCPSLNINCFDWFAWYLCQPYLWYPLRSFPFPFVLFRDAHFIKARMTHLQHV